MWYIHLSSRIPVLSTLIQIISTLITFNRESHSQFEFENELFYIVTLVNITE